MNTAKVMLSLLVFSAAALSLTQASSALDAIPALAKRFAPHFTGAATAATAKALAAPVVDAAKHWGPIYAERKRKYAQQDANYTCSPPFVFHSTSVMINSAVPQFGAMEFHYVWAQTECGPYGNIVDSCLAQSQTEFLQNTLPYLEQLYTCLEGTCTMSGVLQMCSEVQSSSLNIVSVLQACFPAAQSCPGTPTIAQSIQTMMTLFGVTIPAALEEFQSCGT